MATAQANTASGTEKKLPPNAHNQTNSRKALFGINRAYIEAMSKDDSPLNLIADAAHVVNGMWNNPKEIDLDKRRKKIVAESNARAAEFLERYGFGNNASLAASMKKQSLNSNDNINIILHGGNSIISTADAIELRTMISKGNGNEAVKIGVAEAIKKGWKSLDIDAEKPQIVKDIYFEAVHQGYVDADFDIIPPGSYDDGKGGNMVIDHPQIEFNHLHVKVEGPHVDTKNWSVEAQEIVKRRILRDFKDGKLQAGHNTSLDGTKAKMPKKDVNETNPDAQNMVSEEAVSKYQNNPNTDAKTIREQGQHAIDISKDAPPPTAIIPDGGDNNNNNNNNDNNIAPNTPQNNRISDEPSDAGDMEAYKTKAGDVVENSSDGKKKPRKSSSKKPSKSQTGKKTTSTKTAVPNVKKKPKKTGGHKPKNR